MNPDARIADRLPLAVEDAPGEDHARLQDHLEVLDVPVLDKRDYTLLSTDAEAAAYAPDKLSMERTASAFTPEDRIGSLELQNLSIDDNRELLRRCLSWQPSLQPAKAIAELLQDEE